MRPAAIGRRPIFMVGSPRSGSSLLFLTLAQAPGVATVGGESHALIESIPGLHPAARGWTSNRLDADDADPATAQLLSDRFAAALRDRDGRAPDGSTTMLEKTPKNSLRVPFLASVFPDGRFLYLYRDPRETMSSMIEAWQSGRFVTYPRLPDWGTPAWSLLLTSGWRDLIGAPLAEVVAHQWATTARVLLDDLAALPSDRIHAASYADVLARPQSTVAAICAAFDLEWDRSLGSTLPPSPTVVSPPHPHKWRRHEQAIARIWPLVADIDTRARQVLTEHAVT